MSFGKTVLAGIFLTLFFCGAVYAGDWLEGGNGYARGNDQSKLTGKPMVLYFYTEWCPYCRKFEKHTLANGDVKKVLEGFVLVRINPEKGSRENQIAEEYRVEGYPAVYFVNPATGQGTQEVTRAVRSAEDFKMAAAEFLRAAGSAKPAAAQAAVSTAAAPEKKTAAYAGPADHILYLKNGRKTEGRLISKDGKGITLAIENLGEVYFSNSEFLKLEEIKK